MEQINYQPTSFEGIVPVLDVGDLSASLSTANQYLVEDQQSALSQIQENNRRDAENLEVKLKGLQDLTKFSQTAAESYIDVRNQQLKSELSDVWAQEFAKEADIDQEALSADYSKTEQEQQELEQDVNQTLANNLTKQGAPDPETTAAAGRVRRRTGIRATVAANARAASAMESYSPAFETALTAENQRRRENGLEPIEPGAGFEQFKTAFNRRWSEMTGLSAAAPGFSAKYVYPQLRREASVQQQNYTRTWNVGEAARVTEQDLGRLVNGEITLETFFNNQRGLTRGDGRTLRTGEDAWAELSKAKLDVSQLSKLAENGGINPVTKQPIADHPRFTALMTDARLREQQQYTLGLNEQKRQGQSILDEYGTDLTEANIDEATQRMQDLDMDPSIITDLRSSARQNTARQERIRTIDLKVKSDIELLDEGQKLPPGYFDGMPVEIKQRYSGFMSPSDESVSYQETLRDSDQFKAVEKDFKNMVGSLGDLGIEFGSDIAGTTGPANFEQFKAQSLNEIALKAQVAALGDSNLSQEEALRQAVSQWRDEQKALIEEDEFFDTETNEFKSAALNTNRGLEQASQLVIRQLDATTADNLGAALQEQDWAQPVTNGQYSERVKYLGRRFGLTPSEVVDMVRAQKGLQPMPKSPTDQALMQISPAERARISALDDQAPISLAIRAQINSGQALTGDAKQRTVAVGQQLLAMGYSGIWQHPDFNYDSGFTGSGREEIGSHAANSYHNHDEALDIGVQANGHDRLEQLYQYLLKNKTRFGISELFYDPDGSRGHPGDHSSHVHVSFGGGDKGTMQ